MKHATIQRYWKWKEKAKKSTKFKAEGTYYSQSEFETLIGHKPAEKPAEPVNTIEEESYGDLEQQDDSGDSEES